VILSAGGQRMLSNSTYNLMETASVISKGQLQKVTAHLKQHMDKEAQAKAA
jgi:hypothetical protein